MLFSWNFAYLIRLIFNQESNGTGFRSGKWALWVILEVKGQYDQNIFNLRVKYLFGKLMTLGIHLHQHNLNFNKLLEIILGPKFKEIAFSITSRPLTPDKTHWGSLKLCWRRLIAEVISFPKRYFTTIIYFWLYWPLTPRGNFPDLKPVPFNFWLKIGLMYENSTGQTFYLTQLPCYSLYLPIWIL